MLALTENASLAIEGILSASTIPDGAGLRIAPPPGEEAVTAGQFQVTVAGTPAETDQVIDEAGARVFVEESVADLLEDKLLDASIVEDQVHFVLGVQDEPGGFGTGSGASGPGSGASGPSPDGYRPTGNGLGDV
jgi:Fe-S cluster assembly iron-binding protein IscA